MNKKAIIFFILFVVSFFISLFVNINKIDIPYFGSLYHKIQVDITFKTKAPNVFFNDKKIEKYTLIDKNHYLYNPKNVGLVKKIQLDNIENIEQIFIYNGKKIQFVDDIKSELEVNNNKSILDKISISFLSMFYNPQYYLISYLFLFLFLYNFQFKINYKISIIIILFLSLILRLSGINDIPFWDDEIYILVHSSPHSKIIELFNDPGNPPLYFIFFKIYNLIVRNENFYRFSSVIIGILFNLAFYFYIKTFLKRKKALIGLFIISINIILIYFSQEIRCYMLMMLLAIINSHLLFKFNKKNKCSYLITILSLLYTHFYGAFFVFYNFLFGISLFNKNKDKIKNFILVNVVAFVLYLPLLIYKHESVTSQFNSWIEPPIYSNYLKTIDTLFGNVIIMFLLFGIIIFLYSKQSKIKKLFIKYNFLVIPFVIMIATIVSHLVKPIFCYRYFYIIFPSALSLICFVVTYEYKTKYRMILMFFMMILFTTHLRLNEQNLFCNHNIYIDYVRHDIDLKKNNYVFMTDTVENYKKFNIDGTKTFYLQVNKGIEAFDYKDYNIKPNSIIYIPNLYLEDYIFDKAKKIDLYKTTLGVFCKITL